MSPSFSRLRLNPRRDSAPGAADAFCSTHALMMTDRRTPLVATRTTTLQRSGICARITRTARGGTRRDKMAAIDLAFDIHAAVPEHVRPLSGARACRFERPRLHGDPDNDVVNTEETRSRR